MYKKQLPSKTNFTINTSYEGERLEQKIERIMNNKEPITDGAPLIYQERKDGVQPEYDIRTDRWDVAIDAMDKVDKTHKAKREERIAEKTFDTMTEEQKKEFKNKFPNNKLNKITGGESVQGNQPQS